MTKNGVDNIELWTTDIQSLKIAQKKYLFYFDHTLSVLDIGCNKGAFLELLRENNIPYIGIDIDPNMVSYCKSKGFNNVYLADAITFLKDKHCCYGGIFCSHVIEHMGPEEAILFIKMCHNALKPGGRLVIITPNPRNWQVISHTFWLDTTHVRPYPLLLLEKILNECSFKIIDKGRGLQVANVSGNFCKLISMSIRRHLRQMITVFRKYLLGGGFYDMDYMELGHEIIIVGEKPTV